MGAFLARGYWNYSQLPCDTACLSIKPPQSVIEVTLDDIVRDGRYQDFTWRVAPASMMQTHVVRGLSFLLHCLPSTWFCHLFGISLIFSHQLQALSLCWANSIKRIWIFFFFFFMYVYGSFLVMTSKAGFPFLVVI